MKVIRASVLGFCMGVENAVKKAQNAIQNEDFKNKKIFSLGPLIHNSSVLSLLKNQGLEVLSENDLNQIDSNSVVLIRAHGTSPKILDLLSKKGAIVIDSTCPKVHLSQRRAKEWHSKDYKIIIAGDKSHGEVLSILSYVDGDGLVLETALEAQKTKFSGKIAILAQTTFSLTEFNKICAEIKKQNPEELKIFNSICNATMLRQNALKELEGKSQGIIVIGGKNSANTKRLFESAKLISANVALIEDETEIPQDFYSLESVALSAGASTPDWIIDKVEQKLMAQSGHFCS